MLRRQKLHDKVCSITYLFSPPGDSNYGGETDSDVESDPEVEEDYDSAHEERSILAPPDADDHMISEDDVAQRLRVYFDLETTGLGSFLMSSPPFVFSLSWLHSVLSDDTFMCNIICS